MHGDTMGTIVKIETPAIKNGPRCSCGMLDWFVGDNVATCECGKKVELDEKIAAYIKDGPTCACGFGDYLLGETSAKCTNCGKTIDISELK